MPKEQINHSEQSPKKVVKAVQDLYQMDRWWMLNGFHEAATGEEIIEIVKREKANERS